MDDHGELHVQSNLVSHAHDMAALTVLPVPLIRRELEDERQGGGYH